MGARPFLSLTLFQGSLAGSMCDASLTTASNTGMNAGHRSYRLFVASLLTVLSAGIGGRAYAQSTVNVAVDATAAGTHLSACGRIMP